MTSALRKADGMSRSSGDHLCFSYALGDHFRKPGIYRVTWRGTGFRSPEVVFRVLPDRVRHPLR